jgi:hypothetical protein
MDFVLHTTGTGLAAELIHEGVAISEEQDAIDLMAEAGNMGAGILMVKTTHLIPGFFDLKTGIAGDILQKFSTYHFRLAIIGDFSGYTGKNLKDFIYESNKTGRILFQESAEKALAAFRTRK